MTQEVESSAHSQREVLPLSTLHAFYDSVSSTLDLRRLNGPIHSKSDALLYFVLSLEYIINDQNVPDNIESNLLTVLGFPLDKVHLFALPTCVTCPVCGKNVPQSEIILHRTLCSTVSPFTAKPEAEHSSGFLFHIAALAGYVLLIHA